MATKSNGGWVILAAALAVPGFLFFQWYSKLDAQKKAEIERHVRRNLPKDAPIFGSAPGGEKLNNPIASGAAPVTGAVASATPVAGAAAAFPGAAGAVGVAAANAAVAAANATAAAQPGAVPVQQPSAAAPGAPAIPGALPAAAAIPAAAVPAAVPPAAAAAAAVPGAVAGAVSAATPLAGSGGNAVSATGTPDPSSPFGSMIQTGPITQIVLARDPMLSPFDMVRIAEDELRKRRAQEEMEAEVKHREVKKHYKPPEKSGDTLVDLQGIISTPDQGDKAIVNGEMVGEGDLIAGVKVLKITPTGVVFTYHNKRFVKSVSK